MREEKGFRKAAGPCFTIRRQAVQLKMKAQD
jgi:hypothetical protein